MLLSYYHLSFCFDCYFFDIVLVRFDMICILFLIFSVVLIVLNLYCFTSFLCVCALDERGRLIPPFFVKQT
jgi:hypothetical protein